MSDWWRRVVKEPLVPELAGWLLVAIVAWMAGASAVIGFWLGVIGFCAVGAVLLYLRFKR